MMSLSKCLIAAWLFAFVMIGRCGTEEPKRKFEETPLPVVETGLQFMSGVNPMPALFESFNIHWLTNRLFVVTVAQEIPRANVLRAERTMLVDAETGKSQELLEPGWTLACFNPVRKVGAIRPSPFKMDLPYLGIDQNDWQYRWVHIETDGTVTKIPDVAELTIGCSPREGYPKDAAISRLHEGHGFIQRIAPGQRQTFEDRAVYFRPNGLPVNLNIYSGEVTGGRYQYLDYAQKYQLTYYDPHGVSSTDKRLAGVSWGDRPYDLTPFRLLSLDGTVEEIPYPTIIYDYGLKGVGYFLFTPVGLLITPKASIMLLNGDRLTRVWGKPTGVFHTPESVFGMKLSPNGCKLAFARTAKWEPDARKPIAILNLCQGN